MLKHLHKSLVVPIDNLKAIYFFLEIETQLISSKFKFQLLSTPFQSFPKILYYSPLVAFPWKFKSFPVKLKIFFRRTFKIVLSLFQANLKSHLKPRSIKREKRIFLNKLYKSSKVFSNERTWTQILLIFFIILSSTIVLFIFILICVCIVWLASKMMKTLLLTFNESFQGDMVNCSNCDCLKNLLDTILLLLDTIRAIIFFLVICSNSVDLWGWTGFEQFNF